MLRTTRIKLIAGFLVVSFLVGGFSLLMGGYALYNAVLQDANNQARLTLRAVDDVYRSHINAIKTVLSITALGSGFRTSIASRDRADLLDRLERLARYTNLDMAGIVLPDGRPFSRIGAMEAAKNESIENPITRHVLDQGKEAAGTVVLSRAFIMEENPAVVESIRFYAKEDASGAPADGRS